MAKKKGFGLSRKQLQRLAEENKALREEILELKKKLYQETMRADFYDTMVDVAEEMFNIGPVLQL